MGGERSGYPVGDENLEIVFWWLDSAIDRPIGDEADDDDLEMRARRRHRPVPWPPRRTRSPSPEPLI